MNPMEDAKKRYDEVPIPEELSKRVQWEVEKAERRRKAENASVRKRRRHLYGWQKGLAAAAAAMAVFVTALNTSTVFCPEYGRASCDRGHCKGSDLPFLRDADGG